MKIIIKLNTPTGAGHRKRFNNAGNVTKIIIELNVQIRVEKSGGVIIINKRLIFSKNKELP